MFVDNALQDHSATVARKVLKRGLSNLNALLQEIYGSSDVTYVACPDFSITLRKERLALGFPIGGYLNFGSCSFVPLDLMINTCGVHMIRLGTDFEVNSFRTSLRALKTRMESQKMIVDDIPLRWNFSKRNHFINIYKDEVSGEHYAIFHGASETKLCNWDYLNDEFEIEKRQVNGYEVRYLINENAEKYYSIAQKENDFFYKSHKVILNEIMPLGGEIVFSDFHFGVINKGEFLMGCSKIPIGTDFPLLTSPFNSVFIATAKEPKESIRNLFGDDYTLVPHGLGMTLNEDIVDILPDSFNPDYLSLVSKSGCVMHTNQVEHGGYSYRTHEQIEEIASKGVIELKKELIPLYNIKI